MNELLRITEAVLSSEEVLIVGQFIAKKRVPANVQLASGGAERQLRT